MPVSIAEGLSCPSCAGDLAPGEALLACAACGRVYPILGGIPCLVPDPALWRSIWLSRLAEFRSATEGSLRTWLSEATEPDLLAGTRARLARHVAGLERQRAAVTELFADLAAGMTQLLPTRPEPGDSAAVLSCYEHVFRDWAWGAAEVAATGAVVRRLFSGSIGRLAVLGAGAGRLAFDVHQAFGPTRTVALDDNPLPFFVAQRLLRGETVSLPECPVAPHADDQVWIQHDLRAPSPPRDGLSLVFGDALRPPFAPGSFDAVLTCWFIDAVRADVRETASVIHRVLAPEGVWINVGPLRFKGSLSQSYGIEEIGELVEQSGFAELARDKADVPYFDSPASGSRRIETVFGFAARKSAPAPTVRIPDPTAAWVADPTLPVPRTEGLTTLGRTSWFTAGALALVDGSRSLTEIAGQVAASLRLDPAQVLDQLRAFFAKLPRE